MKTIKLTKLKLQNFKGVKALEIELKDQTIIEGKNGSGKTSVFDAYSWLLFGKNSQNQTDFSIKTYDSNNNVIHNLEHSVEGTFMIDDSEVVLKRLLREKWSKKKGSETPELTGNETIFFINEVPKSLSEYKLFVDGIISEESQKVLSNPLYFNQTMKWQDRRFILSKLAGDIDKTIILSNLSENHRIELEKMLSTDKTLEDYKKEFVAKRKNIKDELDLIPSRIDEANRSLPDAKNWTEIENEIETKSKTILSIETEIENITKQQDSHFEKISEAKKLKFQKEQLLTESLNNSLIELRKESNDLKKLRDEVKHVISVNINYINQYDELNDKFKKDINQYNKENDELREQFTIQNSSKFSFDDTLAKCPTCSREYEQDKIDEIKNNTLNQLKAINQKDILDIRHKGIENNKKIEEFRLIIAKNNSEIENLKLIIENQKKVLTEVVEKIEKAPFIIVENIKLSPEQKKLQAEIEAIIIPSFEVPDNSNLKSQKAELQAEIDTLKLKLHDKVQIEKGNLRIEELIKQQRLLAQQIANFEKQEIAIESFNNERNNLIEKAVNDKFSLVKFKLFEVQMNKGINEICEATVDGVLFNDINTANKINAGLDVINVLSKYYEVIAPVFLDNRESTTNIIACNSQIISLFVNPKCETLKVN
jgi:hypothetical protein